MLTASISMVDWNVRLTKDIEATAKLSLILTNATMAVPSVMSTLNVKILTAHIHVHAIMDSSVMAALVVISMNVIPESMIVTSTHHAKILLVATNVFVMMVLRVMASLVPISTSVSWIFLVMSMRLA